MKRFQVSVLGFCLLLASFRAFAEPPYDAIVIGAGVAGLTAAEELSAQDKKILILEARDRLGGRVYSDYSWGFSIDLGASWIHGASGNALNDLVGNYPVVANTYSETEPAAMLKDFSLYDKEGKPVPDDVRKRFYQLAKEFDEFCDSGVGKESYESRFETFAANRNLSQADRDLLYYALENIYTYEFAENLKRVSPTIFRAYDRSKSHGINALLPSGYFQLFRRFAEKVPKKFRQVVKAVDYSKQPIEVTTQDTHYFADKVVVTVPLGVLKSGKIKFTPKLPARKMAAIGKLGVGNYEKLYLQFDRVFWDKDKEWIGKLPRERRRAFNLFNYYKYTQKPVLIAFTSGQLARDMEKKGHLQEWVMKRLKMMYGDDIPQPIQVKQTHWGQDPNTLGSYSYLPAKEDPALYEDMAKPVADKLFFAGEATSKSDPSTVLGAYLSGIRAAKEASRTWGQRVGDLCGSDSASTGEECRLKTV